MPVVSGNVSLYNDTSGVSIDPTPVIGMVGRLEDVGRRLTCRLAEGDEVSLVGPGPGGLGGSEYQRLATGVLAGAPPDLDLDLERRVQAAVLEAAGAGLLASAHDCAEGGLAVALAEGCLAGGVGVRASLGDALPVGGLASQAAAILFAEGQSRFLISHSTEVAVKLRALMDRHRVPLQRLGRVEGDRIRIDSLLDVALDEARAAYEGALLP